MQKDEAYANLKILAGLTEGEDQEDEAQSQNIGLEDDNPKQKSVAELVLGKEFTNEMAQSCSSPEEEVEHFLRMVDEPANTNPLLWWRKNQSQFPKLAKLARQYLAVPATSTPSERVFSKAGTVVNVKRASLTPRHVQEIVFLNHNESRVEHTTSLLSVVEAEDEMEVDEESDSGSEEED